MTPSLPSLPELLAPAGSPEALEAALAAGADAVYLGGTRFNARLNAHNFDAAALAEAITHAHRMGGRVYLTLNTLVWDRELPDALEAAYEAASAGVDALIIADLGAAALIRRAIPGLPLHASTQLSGHNAAMGTTLAPLGFSRFVIARETSLKDLAAAVRHNPLEVEVFIHGALCVSHSGQCLFSSLVGGRSGNRGECAQPCRLPYTCAACQTANRPNGRSNAENYPLSLKDLSLAAHVPALIEAGVASLKMEGRMKSPGYVGGVTAIWRRLLDERREATPDEQAALGDLFSRGGFTDGYQTGHIDARMMGVRSEADKARTATAEKAAMSAKYPPHLPATMTFTAMPHQPVTLTVSAPLYRQGGVDPYLGDPDDSAADSVTVTVEGDSPAPATDAPGLTAATVEKQLARTGGTPYLAHRIESHIVPSEDGSGLLLPLSRLNALRRDALDALDKARLLAMPTAIGAGTGAPTAENSAAWARPRTGTNGESTLCRTARFYTADQITPAAIAYFDRLYLPLGMESPAALPVEKWGVILPPVIFDREADAVRRALSDALQAGVRHVLVGNLGHLSLVREVAVLSPTYASLQIHGDFRLNTTNVPAAHCLLEQGFSDLLLSPELTLPRMRDIGLSAPAGAIVYGRLPLMLLEKCAIRAVYRQEEDPAAVCRRICGQNAAVMRDRMGKDFPILREAGPDGRGHRNILYNSLPIGMSDHLDELARARLIHHHFLFSTETPAEVDRVIRAYQSGRPLGGEVRRMVR